MTLTFFRLLAAIVVAFAFAQGKQVGRGGAVLGLLVGLAMGSFFYFGLGAFVKRGIRRVELWRPGILDPPQGQTFINMLIGCSFFFVAVVWFIACVAFACWLTSFLVRRWQ